MGLLTLAFGFVFFLTLILAVQTGRCRNPKLAAWLGVLSGLATVALTFRFAYLRAVANSGTEMAFRSYLEARFDGSGEAAVTKGFVHGSLLVLLWAAEAITLVVLGRFGARAGAEAPFCERCGRWAVTRKLGSVAGVSKNLMQRAALEGDLETLLHPTGDTTRSRPPVIDYTALTCHAGGPAYVSVHLKWSERTQKKGERSSQSETLGEYILITREQLRALEDQIDAEDARQERRG